MIHSTFRLGGGIVLAGLLFALAACGLRGSGRSASVDHFHAASTLRSFSLHGDYFGTFRVLPDHVDVVLESATIFLQNNAPYKGRRRVVSLTALLATSLADTGGTWDRIASAEPHMIKRTMQLREEHTEANLHFLIPLEAGVDLTQCWLVFMIEARTLDDFRGRPAGSLGHSYAHTRRDVFRTAAVTP